MTIEDQDLIVLRSEVVPRLCLPSSAFSNDQVHTLYLESRGLLRSYPPSCLGGEALVTAWMSLWLMTQSTGKGRRPLSSNRSQQLDMACMFLDCVTEKNTRGLHPGRPSIRGSDPLLFELSSTPNRAEVYSVFFQM